MGAGASVMSDFSELFEQEGMSTEEVVKELLGPYFKKEVLQDIFDGLQVDGKDAVPDPQKMKEALDSIKRTEWEKAQWWTFLDVTKLTVGKDAGEIKPVPQTPEQKKRFMFAWADLNGDGFLDRDESARLMELSDQELSDEMWEQLSGMLDFDPDVGMSFVVADRAWSDFDEDFAAIQRLEKVKFMFQWCDKDKNGFVDRAELLEYAHLEDPNTELSDDEWAEICSEAGCDPRKGLTLEVCEKMWLDSVESLHGLILKDEKITQMFNWADTNWNGLLDRKEAERLARVSAGANFVLDEETWRTMAEQAEFDPVRGMDKKKATMFWEDYEEDYALLFGRTHAEAEAAQAYIRNLPACYRMLMLSEEQDLVIDSKEQLMQAAEQYNVPIFCSEEASELAFAWLKRAITTPHGSASFMLVKMGVRALLSSDCFWNGLGCKGNSWSNTPSTVVNDVEWTEFTALCKEKLKEIGDRFKGYYEEHNIGEKLGHLGRDVVVDPANPVRQPFKPCPNLPLKGPGEPFTNDGSGEDQYLMQIKLLSAAFDFHFKQKMKKAVKAATASGGDAESIQMRPAPVKTMLRMAAKLRGDHLNNEAPRPAANVDTIRCGIQCRTPEDLERVYHAINAAFDGGVRRVKNGYSPDVDPSKAFHYRGLLMNIEWKTGIKYSQIREMISSQLSWGLFAAFSLNDPDGELDKFAKFVDAAGGWQLLSWFEDPAIADQEVVLIVEAQLVLDHYMEMRKHTHLYYKVVREPTWAELALDCLPENVEAVGGKLSVAMVNQFLAQYE